jgi:hypothetical protein
MSIVLQGSTSGSCTLQEQAVAGTTVLTLPTTSGTILTNSSAGTVLQVIQTVKTDTFSASPGQNTWVDITGLSVSITPTSATSKILVFIDVAVGSSTLSTGASVVRLMRGSTPIYLGDTAGSRALGISSFPSPAAEFAVIRYSGVFLDSPATTSSTTYKYQIAGQSTGYTVYVNRCGYDANRWEDPRVASSITVMEIAA